MQNPSGLPATGTAWLHEAWRRYAPHRPQPSPEHLPEADAFIEGIVPRGREEAAVVWLIARAHMPRAVPPFGSDDWIGLACRAVYLEFEGTGYGDRRVLRLLERWARWLHATGELSRPSLGDLLGDFDRARVSAGFAPRRSPQPRPFTEQSLELRLRSLGPDEDSVSRARLAMHSVLAFLDDHQGRPGRLHAFDPEAYVLDLWASLRPREQLDATERVQVVGAAAGLFGQIGDIFEILDGTEFLHPDQGLDLGDRMRRLAAGVLDRSAPRTAL